MVDVVSGIHCLLVRCFRRARAQQLARGAALVSGVLPSGVSKQRSEAGAAARGRCAAIGRVDSVYWQRVGGLPSRTQKMSKKIEAASVCKTH